MDYSYFTAGFMKNLVDAAGHPSAALALPEATWLIGVHWPSVLSEDQNSLLNVFQVTSFHQMETRADVVGKNGVARLLTKILRDRRAGTQPSAAPTPLRIHLIGHSFGCRVMCSALCSTLLTLSHEGGLPPSVELRVALLEAALPSTAFDTDHLYRVLTVPGLPLRMLVTYSALDTALARFYADVEGQQPADPADQRALPTIGTNEPTKPIPALGGSGPSDEMRAAFGNAQSRLEVVPNFQYTAAVGEGSRLVVADLAPVHQAHPERAAGLAGHHSDIYSDEVYQLLIGFMFQKAT